MKTNDVAVDEEAGYERTSKVYLSLEAVGVGKRRRRIASNDSKVRPTHGWGWISGSLPKFRKPETISSLVQGFRSRSDALKFE